MNQLSCPAAERRWWAETYGCLALAYNALPDKELVARLATCEGKARDLGAGDIADLLSGALRDYHEGDREAICQDFQDLFMVPGSRYVTPYESVYADSPMEEGGGGRVWGPRTAAVRGFYDRVGLAVAPDYPDLPDYVGLELACMEYLCLREAHCLEEGRTAEADRVGALRQGFAREHLRAWIPALAERVVQRAGSGYHGALARAAARLVERSCGAEG